MENSGVSSRVGGVFSVHLRHSRAKSYNSLFLLCVCTKVSCQCVLTYVKGCGPTVT